MTTQDSPQSSGTDREGLVGMLQSYGQDQLVKEVMTAWEDLSSINEEVASLRQQNRVLELDLQEREDIGAPDRARLIRMEEDLRAREARIIHLERMVEDSKKEIEELSVGTGALRVESLEGDNTRLLDEVEEKTGLLV